MYNGEDGNRTRIDRRQLSGNALPYYLYADGNYPHLGLLIPLGASATCCPFAVSRNVAKQLFTLLDKPSRPFGSRFTVFSVPFHLGDLPMNQLYKRKVEESNFYSITAALWYSKPVAVHTAALSKL
jgi:hypothetical protein